MLEDTVERFYHGQNYGEVRRGVFLIRGENVVLLGEIVRVVSTPMQQSTSHARTLSQDLDAEDEVPLQPVPLEMITAVHKEDFEARKRREAAKSSILHKQKGFSREGGEGDWY